MRGFSRVRDNRESGFTLAELILVLVLIGVAAAIVIPTMTSSATHASLNSATRNMLSLVKFTRSMAVSRHWNCRLEWNAESKQWLVSAEKSQGTEPGFFEKLDVPGRIREFVPKGVSVTGLRVIRRGVEIEDPTLIEFRPDGTSDEAYIYFSDSRDRVKTVGLIPTSGQAMVADFAAENLFEVAQNVVLED